MQLSNCGISTIHKIMTDTGQQLQLMFFVTVVGYVRNCWSSRIFTYNSLYRFEKHKTSSELQVLHLLMREVTRKWQDRFKLTVEDQKNKKIKNNNRTVFIEIQVCYFYFFCRIRFLFFQENPMWSSANVGHLPISIHFGHSAEHCPKILTSICIILCNALLHDWLENCRCTSLPMNVASDYTIFPSLFFRRWNASSIT